MTTVSVALATHNGARFIQEQLESIAVQSYAPYEIVICDDASTDTTVEIVKDFQRKCAVQVRLYQNPQNLGFIRNFEEAIALCQGEIIALCDQDDVWLPEKLQRIIEVLDKNADCGLVFTDAMITDQNLVPTGLTVYSRFAKPSTDPRKTVPDLLKKSGILGCTLAFRAKLLPSLLPISSKLWGHDHWIVFVTAIISHLYMIDEPLMYYRRHTQNTGNAAPLVKRTDLMLERLYSNLSLQSYQTDYQKWVDMLAHLQVLHELKLDCSNIPVLEAGMEQVQARLFFSETRLQMRKRNNWRRIAAALTLLQKGDYHRYTPGVRTLFKDVIA